MWKEDTNKFFEFEKGRADTKKKGFIEYQEHLLT